MALAFGSYAADVRCPWVSGNLDVFIISGVILGNKFLTAVGVTAFAPPTTALLANLAAGGRATSAPTPIAVDSAMSSLMLVGVTSPDSFLASATSGAN